MRKFANSFCVRLDDSVAVRIAAIHQHLQQRTSTLKLSSLIRSLVIMGLSEYERRIEESLMASKKR
jgi:hypothetical protein